MAESSKKKRTTGKRITASKIVEAAKSILKKRTTRKKAAPKKTDAATANKNIAEKEMRPIESQYSSSPVMHKFIEENKQELPAGYGDNRITIMVRDPYWLHAYWEIPGWKTEEVKHSMGSAFDSSRMILRVYDVTEINFNGLNAHSSFDMDINAFARSWYINTANPNRSWCVDLGYLTPDGRFYLVARSNIVSTPRDSMSEEIDEEWVTIDWERMYALSGGFGIGRSSAEIKELIKKRLKEEMFSGLVSSGSLTRGFAPQQKEKDFWLVVNTELIVYGATEPTAKLSVQGLPVKLRPDGTFTMRFALPDGRQEIPIVAVDKDGDQKRQITPAVEKNTK